MEQLAIFNQPIEVQLINNNRQKIVNTISNNYVDVIRNMVAKTEATKETYIRNASHFVAYLQINGVNANSYGAYRNELEKRDRISIKTKKAYMTAAKVLLNECYKLFVLPINITLNIPNFKAPTGHVKDGLSRAEVIRVSEYMKAIKSDSTRLKLTAIFSLFANEGLRQKEVQALTIDDINLKEAYIRVHGKGKEDKERFFITSTTLSALKAHMEHTKQKKGFLFHTKGNPHKPITTRALRKYFTCPKYGVFTRCGIEGKSVHGFRHYNITETLKITNGDLARTRRRSRHSGYDMLIIYDDERLSKNDVAEIEKGLMI